MQPALGDSTENATSGGSPLKKWGPLIGIALVIVVVIVVFAVGGGGDDDEPSAGADDGGATTTTDDGGATDEADGADETDSDGGSGDTADDSGGGEDGDGGVVDTGLLPGVMTISVAEELGIDAEFGDRCDTETGRIKVPSFFAPECFAVWDGDNGGATAPGVTGESIRIVIWNSQDSDPVLNYLTDAIVNDDTNADIEDTYRKLLAYYETYYETYGRSVDMVFFEGSGLVTDPIAARADAVQIAEELDPFMVWGGPALTNAFAEELAARGIPCVSCGPGQPFSFYEENDPLAWTVGMGPQQTNLMMAQFVGNQLAGRPATHAGDEAFQGTERVFGRLWIESSQQSVDLNTEFEADLAAEGVTLAESVSYALDPATIQESAASVIAKMKAAGVTTVLFTGDPVAPRDFTREATAQGYFPEWVLGGSVLVDTNVFARTYDQDQWANAFGVTTLSARVRPEISGDRFTYEWFTGESPAADDTIGVLTPVPGLFYAVLQGIGPELTIENWRTALFDAEATRRAITAPTLSYGDKGRWPDDHPPDFFGVDDMTLIWWNPDQVGLDELDREGAGMYQFVDGGTRYLYNEWPDAEPDVFNPDGAVSMYDERPGDELVPIYDPLPVGS